jgi:hypothetical protein
MTFGPANTTEMVANLQTSNDGNDAGMADFTEILALMDQMKAELRNELAAKKEVYDLDVRMGNFEEELDNMTISIDVSAKKTKDNSEDIESTLIFD